ncbi:MAG: LysR family transcriptional regulator [Kangiellaceae bacterium]|nr:LysR family transcriptional regulator [Kangiellaceae bacterium]
MDIKWNAIKFDWNHAKALFVTVQEGSLSAAARALGMTQSTLSRQVSALERDLGVVLFERIGRGLELTPVGLQLLEHAEAMTDAAIGLSRSATGNNRSVEGSVCISATETTAMYQLPSAIKKLREIHPGIKIELIASNFASDLKRREADIAIRAFRPSQPDLIARKIKDLNYGLYAAKEYFSSIGKPTTVEQVTGAEFIGFDQTTRFIDILSENGLTLSKDQFKVLTEHTIVNWAMVKAGLGIGVTLQTIGELDKKLCRILPTLELPVGELWLVAHRELKNNHRIRVVWDFLIEELREE